MFEVSEGLWAGARSIAARGELDHGNMQQLAAVLEAQAIAAPSFLLVDMTEVTYIDSGGLSVLYTALHDLPEGASLAVVAGRPEIRRILEIGGLLGHEAFRLFATVDEACTGLGLRAKESDQ
jgi:anti-anti-sigma factor